MALVFLLIDLIFGGGATALWASQEQFLVRFFLHVFERIGREWSTASRGFECAYASDAREISPVINRSRGLREMNILLY